MKALVLRENSLKIEEVDEPKLLPGHARLQVLKAGLCGSDMHRINQPNRDRALVLGHEFVGRVIDVNVGSIHDQTLIQIDNIAAGRPTLPCGVCQNCVVGNDNICTSFHGIGRDVSGAFAEHVDVPLSNLCIIPEGMPHKPSVMADVVAVCLHAIDEIAVDVVGKSCLVIGDGAIGATLAVILHTKGAKSVSISSKHKANHQLLSLIAPVVAVDQGDTNQYEYVFETVGRQQLDTIEQAISSVGVRGKIIALGVFPPDFQITFNNRTLFLKEASLTASVAYKGKYFSKAVEFLIANPELATLITHEFDINDFAKGIEAMKNKPESSPVIKVIYSLDKL